MEIVPIQAKKKREAVSEVKTNIYLYIFVMAFSTWLMRVSASFIMKKPISNRFIQSFLYYVPYVTLAVMTFPAIIEATDSPASGAAAMLVCMIAAWFGAGLFPVAVLGCLTVFILELFL